MSRWRGAPPLGYDLVAHRLVLNHTESALVRQLFHEFPRVRSATLFVQQLRRDGLTTKSWTAASGQVHTGKLIDKEALYKILGNPVYLGGEHLPAAPAAIVTRDAWEAVQAALLQQRAGLGKATSRTAPPMPLLKGLLYNAEGHAMAPRTTQGGGQVYRYYLSTQVKPSRGAACVSLLPAGEVESTVIAQLRALLHPSPVPVSCPVAQHGFVQRLVERVTVSPEALHIRVRQAAMDALAAAPTP